MITARSQETGASFVPRLPSRIPSLDGLRAVSITLVLIGHSAVCSNAPAFLTHFDHARNFGVRASLSSPVSLLQPFCSKNVRRPAAFQ
jgi:hypothetical protein